MQRICKLVTSSQISKAWTLQPRTCSMTAAKRTISSLSPPPQKRTKVGASNLPVEDEEDEGWDEQALIAAAEVAEDAASHSVASSSSQQKSSQPSLSWAKSPSAKGVSVTSSSKGTPKSSQGTTLLTTPDDPLALERSTMDPEWFAALESEMSQPYFRELKAFLASEASSGQAFYPPLPLIHSWSRLTPLRAIKVVILGQDPYHGPGQAHGMSFSVPKGVAVPGSLRNIYKELSDEYPSGPEKFVAPKHGNLEGWAKQGVLLLNASLTVRQGQAGSHHNKGWERFTKAILKLVAERANGTASTSSASGGTAKLASTKEAAQGSKLMGMFQRQQQKQEKKSSSADAQPSKEASLGAHSGQTSTKPDATDKDSKESKQGEESVTASSSEPSSSLESKAQGGKGIVFLSWGLPASRTLAEAGVRASSRNILLLQSPHPSPLSAHRGFLGNGHFKKANDWLEQESRLGKDGGVRWGDL